MMTVDLWCAVVLNTPQHIDFFRSCLESLNAEKFKPRQYVFAVSGCDEKTARNLLQVLDGTIWLIHFNEKTAQYRGLYTILQSYDYDINVPSAVLFMDGDDTVSNDRTQWMFEQWKLYGGELSIISFATRDYPDGHIKTEYDQDMIMVNGNLNGQSAFYVTKPFQSSEDTPNSIHSFDTLHKFLKLLQTVDQPYADVIMYTYPSI